MSVEVFQCKPCVLGHSEVDIVSSELSTSFSSVGKSSSSCGELDLHFLRVKQAKDKSELRSDLNGLASGILLVPVRQSST